MQVIHTPEPGRQKTTLDHPVSGRQRTPREGREAAILAGVVTFRLDLVGCGWAASRISDGETEAVATASYLSDGIGDFVAAVLSLLRSAQTARCEFAEEPGDFLWELERQGTDVLIRVQWLPEGEPPEVQFSGRCQLADFVRQVDAELDRNLGKWGAEGFEREWGHRFPAGSHAGLKEAIATESSLGCRSR